MKLRYPVATASLWLLGSAARPAAAEPHKIIVMQAEGRADAATRAKIDAAIVKLVRTSEPQTTAGELTFTDAATAVGCRPEVPSCADDVLAMLAVDEIVITSVAPKPGGLQIVVQRVARGAAMREASVLIPSGSDKLDGLASLFGDAPAPRPAPPKPATRPPAAKPAPTPPPPAPAITTGPTPGEPEFLPYVAPQPELAPVDTAPQPVDTSNVPYHRLELAGMGTGAGLLVLGVFFWGAARGAQTDVENAPTATREDLAHLHDLESKGDSYATAGNLLVLTGVALGGVATYFYIRDHRNNAPARVARLTPALFDHGAGVVLTLGGRP